MKIGIVTVYETMNNLGSFLQGYALKTFLEGHGHEVVFLERTPMLQEIKKTCFKLNPKREFFLRFQKCHKFMKALKKLKVVKKDKISDLDLIIYGSDEIWNMDNPAFKDPFYFGTDIKDKRKIAYAISAGAMESETLKCNMNIAAGINEMETILVRDAHTKQMVEEITGANLEYVCDPTLLIPLEKLEDPISVPKEKYLFVYTYGIDKPLEDVVVKFARERGLKIVSACFWHLWCDKIVQCSPLQFSKLIAGAEYVFTTTFHGAIFTMLNHKKCCIYPVREKVKDVVTRLGAESRLIDKNILYDDFCMLMEKDFPTEAFDKTLLAFRKESATKLLEAINNEKNN